MSDCNRCLWATRNGSCASWDCRFVDQREAYEAYNRGKEDANKWIPCSERLPEVGVNVLVCDIDNDIYLTHMSPYKSFYDEFCDYIKNVKAWMPLPEPYKEEEE